MADILNAYIFKCIFQIETRILIQFSLYCVHEGPIDNRAALVQAVAWRQTGDKQ